jgi:hypothetical protein
MTLHCAGGLLLANNIAPRPYACVSVVAATKDHLLVVHHSCSRCLRICQEGSSGCCRVTPALLHIQFCMLATLSQLGTQRRLCCLQLSSCSSQTGNRLSTTKCGTGVGTGICRVAI